MGSRTSRGLLFLKSELRHFPVNCAGILIIAPLSGLLRRNPDNCATFRIIAPPHRNSSLYPEPDQRFLGSKMTDSALRSNNCTLQDHDYTLHRHYSTLQQIISPSQKINCTLHVEKSSSCLLPRPLPQTLGGSPHFLCLPSHSSAAPSNH